MDLFARSWNEDSGTGQTSQPGSCVGRTFSAYLGRQTQPSTATWAHSLHSTRQVWDAILAKTRGFGRGSRRRV